MRFAYDAADVLCHLFLLSNSQQKNILTQYLENYLNEIHEYEDIFKNNKRSFTRVSNEKKFFSTWQSNVVHAIWFELFDNQTIRLLHFK